MLRCIAGFERYDGEIYINGQKSETPGTDRIMVFQDFNQLFPWKTVEKNTHYGSFNRVTTFQVIGIGDCIGYDQTTDLEHYMMTTDFELKQVDGEGRSFGCNQELELPSREDCLKVKEELIRDEKS